jgi:DNA-binding IclR family transcriptional regulator
MSTSIKRRPAPASEPADDRTEVSALARGLALLHAIVSRGPLPMRDLAEACDLPKATVSRLVATLLGHGYLRQDEGSALLRLGPAFLAAGNAYLNDLDMRAVLRPHLLGVANLAGAKVNLGIRSGLEVVIVDSIRPHTAMILSYLEIGSRMDLATSAAGRAYLASLDDDDRAALGDDLRRHHGSAWRSLSRQLDDAVAEYRSTGFCSSFGEWHPDINAIGAVALGQAGERFLVSCGGPVHKHTPDFLRQQVAPALLRALRDWTPRPRTANNES